MCFREVSTFFFSFLIFDLYGNLHKTSGSLYRLTDAVVSFKIQYLQAH